MWHILEVTVTTFPPTRCRCSCQGRCRFKELENCLTTSLHFHFIANWSFTYESLWFFLWKRKPKAHKHRRTFSPFANFIFCAANLFYSPNKTNAVWSSWGDPATFVGYLSQASSSLYVTGVAWICTNMQKHGCLVCFLPRQAKMGIWLTRRSKIKETDYRCSRVWCLFISE